jgi:hypothetical protein
MIIVNDATSWSVTLELSFMLQELSISCQLCSQRTLIILASLMMIIIYNCHIFMVQATLWYSALR